MSHKIIISFLAQSDRQAQGKIVAEFSGLTRLSLVRLEQGQARNAHGT